MTRYAIGDNFRMIEEIEMELLKNIFRARKGQAEKAIVKEVIDNLRLISLVGRNVSDFYQLCGEVYGDEKDFCHASANGFTQRRRLEWRNWLRNPKECS